MTPRKIPLRKCTGCGEMKDKREMIRVVRNDAGEFLLDTTGKKSGRGAYLCRNISCFTQARKHNGFGRSFRHPVPDEIYASLLVELETELKKDLEKKDG
jgi:predicted RNA-binding protein YlxR (DUF448 family)